MDDGSTLWYGIITDITERKLAEEKIKEQQLLFETMFNAISDGVVITNTERKILLANNGMQSTFGYSTEEIIGKSTEILYADKEKFVQAGETIFNISSLGSDNFYMTSYKDKNNSIFSGETFGAKLYDSKGEWIGNLSIMRNISERIKYIEELKIAQKKAEESDRLKTAFLHNISHEIRTPMNAIIGFSELIINPKILPEKGKYYAEVINNSCNQLLSIITDIINIATIEAGQAKIENDEFNLNSIFKFIHQQFILKAEKQNIMLGYKTALPDDEAVLITDRTKFIEVLTNIIGNALKFTKEGSVEFGYLVADNYLEFYVKDTGIGIPAEMRDDIFLRFRQVEVASTRQFGGTGLGLAISKAYVELLGGKIWLTSVLNKGSIFYFTIPYTKQVQSISPVISVSEIQGKIKPDITLLIAEDEDSNYMLLVELLADMEIKILRASNGIETVEICKSNPNIDLVLMDIKMPEMDGIEATRQIKKMRPYLPVIAQSAYSFPEEKKQAYMAGCNLFVSKPIKKVELLQAISQVIDN
jgi:PAS domain S-box-containing protein